MSRLYKLAKDPDPSVRLAVATAARQFVSGSLTVNIPPAVPVREAVTGGVLSGLWFSSHDAKDPLIPFMYWMAVEPIVAFDPVHALGFYKEDGAMKQMPLSGILITKIMRRVCDLRDPVKLDQSIAILGKLKEEAAPVVLAALNGLLEGQRGKAITPGQASVEVVAAFAKFSNKEVAARAEQLGALWGDAASLKRVLARATDASASEGERLKAIQTVRQNKSDATRDAMLSLLVPPTPDVITVAAIAALGEIGGDTTAGALIQQWKNLSPAAKRAAAETLVARRDSARAFLAALEQKTISASDLPATTVRSLVNSKDDYVKNNAARIIGRVREADADKLKLIAAKRQIVLAGEPDRAAGREVARKTCLTCHKFHGEGGEVGPDLTGVGRSTLDALLHNVIHPNEIIGAGYENVEVETKDGRSVAGRLVENTDTRVKLLSAGPKEEVVAKADIATTRVSELSVMPEGLEQMPDADFRNLIWYLLNPPQDNKPLTPEYRRQLLGDSAPVKAASRSASFRGQGATPGDGESVALWNPEWRVLGAPFEGAPKKLTDYAGRKNVLMTHPAARDQPARLERSVELPSGQRTQLDFAVAADELGDWELRVLADGKLLHKQLVTGSGASWTPVRVDLSAFAGKTVALRLENFPNGWNFEFGYWSDLRLTPINQSAQAR